MNNISIVILAAGKGSRMKSSKAKVLHSISGKSMLYHIVKESFKVSNDVTVVVAHQKDAVVAEVSKYFSDVKFVVQDDINFPGTGGAMKSIDAKYEKVLVLNGDMPLITADALNGFLDTDADIVLSIFDLKDPSGYGRVKIDDGEVSCIVEQKDASPDELRITYVNAGIYAFKKEVLDNYIPRLDNNNAQSEYYLTDVISMAKKEGLVIKPLLVDEEHFKGVNSKADLASAEVIMQERIRNEWMLCGVTMQLPHTIYIEEGVRFEGECTVENNCRITGNSVIKNSIIKSSSVIEESEVINSDVGPLAHLRPASKIEDTHIGNFVEVKKSNLKGVKAGHLSYIGDSEVDEGTNIGAGMITCNYDGMKKHKTIIGKNVFIGSDCQLVAPVEIEDDVIVAAGTTVTSGKVKKGSLAISRTKLSFIEGFYYKFFANAK